MILVCISDCDVDMDLAIVIDNSGSIKNESTQSLENKNYDNLKKFVKSLLDILNIGQDDTRVGVVRYGLSGNAENENGAEMTQVNWWCSANTPFSICTNSVCYVYDKHRGYQGSQLGTFWVTARKFHIENRDNEVFIMLKLPDCSLIIKVHGQFSILYWETKVQDNRKIAISSLTKLKTSQKPQADGQAFLSKILLH